MSRHRHSHRHNRLLAAGFTLLAAMPLPAQAAGMVLTGEIAFGGDKLASVSGDYDEDLRAGQLLNLGIGFDFDLNPAKTLLLRAGINYKFDAIDADNGEADFDRWPLDLILVSRQGNLSLGAGLTYHLSPTYEDTIDNISRRIDFDDALGFLLQVGFMVTPTMELGGRVTLIEYESDMIANRIDGDSFGIYISVGL
ncbi:MAG: hypothetical protein AB1560_08865 [Pseudomonadota bacterium]